MVPSVWSDKDLSEKFISMLKTFAAIYDIVKEIAVNSSNKPRSNHFQMRLVWLRIGRCVSIGPREAWYQLLQIWQLKVGVETILPFVNSGLFFNSKTGWRVLSILFGNFLPWCSRGGRAVCSGMLFYRYRSKALVWYSTGKVCTWSSGDGKLIVCSMANLKRISKEFVLQGAQVGISQGDRKLWQPINIAWWRSYSTEYRLWR